MGWIWGGSGVALGWLWGGFGAEQPSAQGFPIPQEPGLSPALLCARTGARSELALGQGQAQVPVPLSPLSPLSPAFSPPRQCHPRGRCPQLCPSQSQRLGESSTMSPNIPPEGSQAGALCPREGSRLSPVPRPLSPTPQPCSCIPSLQNLLEILWMQILAAAPCQELELQSREGSRLRAQRPPPRHSRPLESSLKPHRGLGREWLCGTLQAEQVWGKVSKS